MRLLSRLIIKVYRFIYLIVRVRILAFILAILYIAALHYISLLGISLLVLDWLPSDIAVNYLLTPPYCYGIAFAFVAVNYFVLPPFTSIIVEFKEGSDYKLVIIYSAIGLMLLGFEYITLPLPN